MHVSKKMNSDTEAVLTIVPNEAEILAMKEHVLAHFVDKVKLPGFRSGKAPLALIEKNVDQSALQSEFLEEAVSQMYQQAVAEQKLRVVEQPEITVKKFVPFTQLEFEAKLPIVGDISLPDYKKIKQTRSKVSVDAKDVAGVLASLQQRLASKQTVDRPVKKGDEVIIDFKGEDDKGKAIAGADGKDYPLIIGSDAFIPGFEDNLIGLAADKSKTFQLTFPKDYGVNALANKKVTFHVTAKQVHELTIPKLDDAFATQAGPFKTLAELKTDIKRQLTVERQAEADRNDESNLVKKISDKSKVAIPQPLINSTVESMLRDLKQNLTYRGQTYQEFLDMDGKTDEEYRKELAPVAAERVKASLVLAEIAEQEKLDVSLEELEARIHILKGQYQDQAMQAELDKPENRQDIASRLLTEKVLDQLKKTSFVS